MNTAVSQADTLCFFLFLPMRQGGSRGAPRASKLWVADSRLRCWLVTKLCGFRTAVCTPQIDLFFFRNYSQKRKNAVWVEPLTDTWNSFIRHSLAAKRSDSGFCLFCKLEVTIQIVNSCGECSCSVIRSHLRHVALCCVLLLRLG